MKFIQGKDRSQTEFFCLEQAVSDDNEVRLIDLFVHSIGLSDFGFKMDFIDPDKSSGGRPAYHPADLLKLFIYGYMNRIRSSRQLEKECKRNIELMWLMKGLSPDHNTISNFRRDNPKAIQKVFRSTVELAKNFELIGGKLLAGDSTKLRAQNSKKNNFNEKKIERHLAYIDEKLSEYSAVLAREDQDSSPEKKTELASKIKQHQENKIKYESLQKELERSDEVQISTSDPDSRQLLVRNNITEVGYNIQTTVDAQHNIPIDFKVTNKNDSKAMGAMVRRAKTILGTNEFTALYDKGYHTGSEFEYAFKHGIEVIVAAPDVASHAPDIAFDVENFEYNKERDSYTCPAGQELKTNGSWYTKAHGKTINKIKHYKTKACLSCEFFARCTRNKSGRLIERTEYQNLIEENKKRLNENMQTYRKRQAIVEHPFGIIKRQWDFYYILTKRTIKNASADVGFIFTAYNLRRIFNLIDKITLKKFFQELVCFILFCVNHFKLISYTFFEFNASSFFKKSFYKRCLQIT